MADDKVDVVRRAYDAYARGDLAAAASAYSEDTVSLERAVEVGDRVVAVIEESGRGRSSDAPVTIRYGRMITVRRDKIVETVVSRNPADAFDAARPAP